MRLLYVELNQSEASDKTLMEVLDRFCVGVSLSGAAVVQSIGPDNPSVGSAIVDPAATGQTGAWNPEATVEAPINTAAIFGGQQPQLPVPPNHQPPIPVPGFPGVPSTAVAVPPSTAPAVLPGTSPMAPGAIVPPVPTPAPTVVAPSAPAAPTNPAGGVELDSTGLPWDARIHSSAKSKTESGEWRAKKGLNDKALVERIKAELRAAAGAPAVTHVPTPPATLAPAVAQQQAAQVAQTAAAAALPPAPPPTPPAPPVAPPVPTGPTMASLMQKLSPHMTSGLLNQARQAHLLSLVGVESLPGLMSRPDLIAKLEPAVDQWVAYWQQVGPEVVA